MGATSGAGLSKSGFEHGKRYYSTVSSSLLPYPTIANKTFSHSEQRSILQHGDEDRRGMVAPNDNTNCIVQKRQHGIDKSHEFAVTWSTSVTKFS